MKGEAGHPLLVRTNPKGTDFVGRCPACGKTDLTFAQQDEPCANPEGMTQERALVEAIDGESVV